MGEGLHLDVVCHNSRLSIKLSHFPWPPGARRIAETLVNHRLLLTSHQDNVCQPADLCPSSLIRNLVAPTGKATKKCVIARLSAIFFFFLTQSKTMRIILKDGVYNDAILFVPYT